MAEYDVTVIGGGPAGLSAALAADGEGAKVLLIEREARLGGILKQCIHDGFGLARYGEKLSGPEYVARDIREVERRGIDTLLLTFVTKIDREEDGFTLTAVNRDGVTFLHTKAIVFATGCRERTAKQVKIHGTRPAGVLTAGAAQSLVNLHGLKIARRCVVLGSGDIGLIMARRLTLEGAEVVGVYEIMPKPAGLARNVSQCLKDYGIPLHLSHTVTRVFGDDRLEKVEVSEVDKDLKPIPGTEELVDCDCLILSVGLIPENELAETLGVEMDPKTRGPKCDTGFMSSVPGVFAAGNCLFVYDLVDYVSEDAAKAGKAAAEYCRNRRERGTEFVSPVKHQPEAELGPDQMTCIVCPNSCTLTVTKTEDGWKVEGNKCKRGERFAIGEMTNPVRTISSTVATSLPDLPVLPVRVSAEFPKQRIFDVMREIDKVRLERRPEPGEAVIADVCGLGIDVIAAE